MLAITSATYLNEYKIELEFNDRKRGIADLRDFILNEKRSVFFPLKDTQNFSSFELNFSTITWQNRQIDLAMEFLYFQTFKTDPNLQDTFKTWGYID